MKKTILILCSLLLFCTVQAQDTVDFSLPNQAYRNIPFTFQYALFDSSDIALYGWDDNYYPRYYWPHVNYNSNRNVWICVVTKHIPAQMPPIYGIGIPIWQLPERYWIPGMTAGKMKIRPIIVGKKKESDVTYPATYGRIIDANQLYTRPSDAYVKVPCYPNNCDTSYVHWACSKVFYLYFDSAITMSDTFYFGVAWKGWQDPGLCLSNMAGTCEIATYDEQYDYLRQWYYEQYDSTDFSHVRVPVPADDYGIFTNIPFFLLFNPPDTDSYSCPEVEDFTYLGIQADYPTFMWTAPDSVHQYEVCYGPYDADPDTLPTVTIDSSNICVLTDRTLSPDIYYQARCRAVCRHICPIHDTILHAPWSAPQYFYTGSSMPDTSRHDTSHVALSQPLSPLPFTLSPNPAHGSVTLLLPEGALPATLLLHDAACRQVLRRRITDPQTTLSTRTLPAGLYHVTVSTPSATATQKLTVR